jgi:RND superfamily putative drug exporter
VVVGLALILLMVVFRSILVPLKAAGGFLLSIAAAMGVVVWIFQDGNLADLFGVSNPSPIVSFLPILLIGILFGLAMDYEVFLVSRMREAFVHGAKAARRDRDRLRQSARVVVAGRADHDRRVRRLRPRRRPDRQVDRPSLAFGVLATPSSSG